MLSHTIDQRGRLVTVNVNTDMGIITLMSVYGPNKDEPQFFKQMIDRDHEQKLIIGGDFNIVSDENLDALDKITSANKRAGKML